MVDPFASFRLASRTALVTGARREIGRAIALGLAGAGARLAIHHAGSQEELSDATAVVREIQEHRGEAKAFGQDFARDGAGHQLAAAVTLCHHARALRPPDRRQPADHGWGRVVTIGSVQQERPHPAMFVYAGTKAAQLNWVLNLVRQFGGQGMTVSEDDTNRPYASALTAGRISPA